jgi:hypothetical protein
LAEVVRCSALNTAAGRGDETLNSGCVVSAGEFFFLGLDALEDGDGEDVGIDLFVEVENLQDFLLGFRLVEEGSVAFLPEEFAGPEEGFWESAQAQRRRKGTYGGS